MVIKRQSSTGSYTKQKSRECLLTSHRLLGAGDQFSYQSRDAEFGVSAPTKSSSVDMAEQLRGGNTQNLLGIQLPCTSQAQCLGGVERCHQQSMSLIKSLSSALVNHARSSTLLTKVAYSGNTSLPEERLLTSSHLYLRTPTLIIWEP